MNIIFDLGGVVVTWSPEKLVQCFTNDARVQDDLLNKLVRHRDWIELDRGTLSIGEAVSRCSERTGLDPELVLRFINCVPPSLTPVNETIELMHQLKDSSHRLYCLSNMHDASIKHLEKSYSFMEMFEGAVISCRIKMVKPDPEIFEYIISKYSFEPGRTLFIDDSPANIISAKKTGLRTILFRDAGQCRQELEVMGLFT